MGVGCSRRERAVHVVQQPPLTQAQSAQAKANWRRVWVVVLWLRARRRWARFGQLLRQPEHCAVWQGLDRLKGVLCRPLFFDGRQNLIALPKAVAKAKPKAKAQCSLTRG